MSRAPARRGDLITVFLTVLIDLLGFGIIIPLLPLYSEAYGADEVELALLFSSFSAMQFVFAPLWGRLSDRIGRKPVLIGGLVGTSASYVLFGLADSLGMLMVSRLLAGFFGANISTAQAFIADVTDEQGRAKGMGMVGAAFGLGFTLGPLIGGRLPEHGGMGLPGFFAAGTSALAALYGFFALREPETHRGTGITRTFDPAVLRRLFADVRVRTVLALYFTSILAFSAFETMFIRFGLVKFPEIFYPNGGAPVAGDEIPDELLFKAAKVAGNYLFFIGLISALVQGGLIRRLVPRFGETKLVVAGPLLLGLSLAIIGAAPTWSVVILGCVFMPFGMGFNNPSLQSLLSRSVSTDDQGVALGVNQSLASLARVAGPMLAGPAFLLLGPESPLLLAALLLFGAAFVAWRFGARHGHTYPRKSPPASADA